MGSFWLVALAMALVTSQEASRPSFSEWLEGVRQEALARGIRQEIVDEALGHLDEPMPVILERDRAQAETLLSLEAYVKRLLTPKFMRTGREMYGRHRALLDQVSERYGVPSRIIAAVWGVESNFGRFSGVRPTIAALATLAWDPRRSSLFRGELLEALEILNRGEIDLDHMRGSWAGAMGQVQFMPSSYLKFAEDFDGDGRRDIWSTPADVFASIANYLKGHGWKENEGWGREVAMSEEAARRIRSDVRLREGSCRATRDMTVPLPIERWQELGVRLRGAQPKGVEKLQASLVSGTTRHFLVYGNYDALLEYNCSQAYAISVALLGDALASKGPTGAPKRGKADPSRRRGA
jgi:membrane-bound lytic murein transglycosylase B